MLYKEKLNVVSSEFQKHFLELASEISFLAFAPGHDSKFLKFIGDPDKRSLFNNLFGRHLGCHITRWYFYDREQDTLEAFSERLGAGRGIDPNWIKIKGRLLDDTYEYEVMGQDEKTHLETMTAGKRTATKFYKWFLNGQMVWTTTESLCGWVCVRREELLLGCFEWLLYRGLREALRAGEIHLSGANGEREPAEATFSSLNVISRKAVAKLVEVYGDEEDDLFDLMINGLVGITNDYLNGGGNYSAWYDRSLREGSQDWWIRLVESGNALNELTRLRGIDDLARLIVGHGEIIELFHVSSRAPFDELERRHRFHAESELALGTRNLVFFPLWLGSGQESHDPVHAAFTAFVLGTFYDEDLFTSMHREIRAVFTLTAFPNIIEIGIEAYQKKEHATTRADAIELLSRCIGHDMNNRLYELSGALKLLSSTIPNPSKDVSRILRATDGSVDAAMRQARNMLDVVRQREITLEMTNVDILLDRVIELVSLSPDCTDRGIRIQMSRDTVGFAELDSDVILRCVENILLNAVQASPDKGIVSVYAVRNSGSIEIQVRDHGAGISSSVVEAAAEGTGNVPSKYGRGGVGLISALRGIHSHGGQIRFQRPADSGTVVFIVIPILFESSKTAPDVGGEGIT